MLEPISRRAPAETKYLCQFNSRVVTISGIDFGSIANRDHLAGAGAGV